MARHPTGAQTVIVRTLPRDPGSLPENWVQAAGDDELRYYQPLVVREMCTQCHGLTDTLDPAVRERLEDPYPEDRAVGYAAGDFRGLIRVAIPRAALAMTDGP